MNLPRRFFLGSTAVLAVLVVVAIPLIASGGFGPDNDPWGELGAALRTLSSGTAHLSRPPGNPVHEGVVLFLTAVVGRLHLPPPTIPIVMDLLSLVSAVVAYRAFVSLCRELNVDGRVAVVAGCALLAAPSVLIHCADATEYLPALAFGLAALRYRNARGVIVVLLYELSAGNRLSACLLLFPLAALYARDGQLRARAPTLLACVMAFVLVRLGLYAVAVQEGDIATDHFNLRRIVAGVVFGWLGLAGAGAFLLAWWSARQPSARPPDSQAVTRVALAGLVPQLLLYAFVPNDPAYLSPALPFLLLALAARGPSMRAWLGLTAVLVAGNLVAIRGFDTLTRRPRAFVTAGPYPIAIHQAWLPAKVFDDFVGATERAGGAPIAYVVRGEGTSNLWNGGWARLYSMYPDRHVTQLDADFAWSSETEWHGSALYVVPRATQDAIAVNSIDLSRMQQVISRVCARAHAAGRTVLLDDELAAFRDVGDCAAPVTLFHDEAKDPRLDYMFMSF